MATMKKKELLKGAYRINTRAYIYDAEKDIEKKYEDGLIANKKMIEETLNAINVVEEAMKIVGTSIIDIIKTSSEKIEIIGNPYKGIIDVYTPFISDDKEETIILTKAKLRDLLNEINKTLKELDEDVEVSEEVAEYIKKLTLSEEDEDEEDKDEDC